MDTDRQRDWQDALDRRGREIVERALANEELMEATREGVQAVLRGEKGVPYARVKEEARRQRGLE